MGSSRWLDRQARNGLRHAGRPETRREYVRQAILGGGADPALGSRFPYTGGAIVGIATGLMVFGIAAAAGRPAAVAAVIGSVAGLFFAGVSIFVHD